MYKAIIGFYRPFALIICCEVQMIQGVCKFNDFMIDFAIPGGDDYAFYVIGALVRISQLILCGSFIEIQNQVKPPAIFL